MAFKYPRRGVFVGEITSFSCYTTVTGKIYIYHFLHAPDDGPMHEIMLHTRNHQVEKEHFDEMFGKHGKLRDFPHKAEVTIASDGLAFEVFEIKILE